MQFRICLLALFTALKAVMRSLPGCLDPTAVLIISTTISGSGEEPAGLVNIES